MRPLYSLAAEPYTLARGAVRCDLKGGLRNAVLFADLLSVCEGLYRVTGVGMRGEQRRPIGEGPDVQIVHFTHAIDPANATIALEKEGIRTNQMKCE